MTTTAVILAAGKGTRLRESSQEPPKPLTPIAGIPLIQREMHTARLAGIKRFVFLLVFYLITI